MKEIRYYKTIDNKIPFLEWLETLKDSRIIKKIFARLNNLKNENFGDHRGVGGGVLELRFRAGIRIFYGMQNNILVIILIGSDKDSQQKNINLAINYWNDHKKRFGGKQNG